MNYFLIGGIAVGRTPKKKFQKNCGKLRKIWVKEIAAVNKKNFGFPDSGQGKGRQKLQFQTKKTPEEKIILHVLWAIYTIF